MLRGRWISILVALVVAASAPASALQPCRPPRPAELVWPGWQDDKLQVAGDAMLLLRLHVSMDAVRDVWLAPVKGAGKRVPLRLEPVRELGLFGARAAKPIRSGGYELWVRAPQPRQRWGPLPPGGPLEDLKLYPPINVVRGRASRKPPRLPKPRVRFGPWGERDGNMRHLRRAGRDVTLVFGGRGGRDAPAFVVVRGAYSDGKARHEVLEVQPYRKQVLIGSRGSARCASRSPILTPAPKQGSYELSVTPWSAAGVKGKSAKVSGPIR